MFSGGRGDSRRLLLLTTESEKIFRNTFVLMRDGMIVATGRSRTLTCRSQTDRTRHQIISILLFFSFEFSSKDKTLNSSNSVRNLLPETNDDANSDDQTTDDTENGHEKKKEIQPLNRSIIDGRKKWTNTSTVENFSRTKLFEDRT